MLLAVPGDVATDLDDAALALIGRIAPNLNLLADLIHADILLFVSSGDRVAIVKHARPEPVPSVYSQDLTGRQLVQDQVAPVARVLFQGSPRHQVQGAVVSGVPIVREVFAVRDAGEQVCAAVVVETAVIEHERLRRRSAIYRRAIIRARDQIVEGRMEGGERLSRLGRNDGIMVIEPTGEIKYVTAVAEGLYRQLGYVDSLVNTQLSELDTNEYIAFRAIELGACLEQRVTEQDRIWIKKVVPLLPSAADRWLTRLPGRPRNPTGAIIIIQDVTDEVRKEQELRVKNTMIQEIHHRVKNNLQTIAGLVRLQARRTGSEEAAEILKQTVSRIQSVAVVHEFLSKDESSIINIHEVSNRILQEVTHGTLDSEKNITLTLEGSRQFLLPAQQATSCALIINELLQNAVEHGYEGRDEGKIVVRLLQTEDSMAVEIEDDGVGLPTNFDLQRGGLGLRIVRTLVKEDLKGQLQLEDGAGVRVVVSFPRWHANGAGARPSPAVDQRTGGTS
jgi:two-component system, sensor histidine kinase PdtaS